MVARGHHASALVVLGVLAAALVCAGVVVVSRQAGRPEARLSTQGLFYSDRGPTWAEKDAIKESKALARKVRLEEKNNPSLVQRFMKAYHAAGVALTEEYDYEFKPWAHEHGLKGSRTSQLKVMMTECVKCVSECPAYVKHPIKADSFDDFSHLAKKECGMCYEGVKGPCPANADNHGVLRGYAMSLHAEDPGPNPTAWTYVKSPYIREIYPRSMGTNQVFLGKAYKAAFARRSATLKVHSKGLTSLHTAGKGQPNPVEGTYATSPYDKSVTPHITDTNQVFLGRVD